MNRNKDKIEQLIRMTLAKCESWIVRGDDGLDYFIDPNDGVEISAHYGATHAAVAFIYWGQQNGDRLVFEKGISLLKSILKRWDKSKALPAFHYDFNNFALSMVENLVDEDLRKQIRRTVLHTNDSNHDTINWLPMRWAVNRAREQWTNSSLYEKAIDNCKKVISDATNADGGIEDRLPYGMSFNLQYDLATVAIMQYLRCEGQQNNLSLQLGFLLNCVAPDGDINYLGRGTNQIFAWGLWVYLLSSSRQVDACGVALNYLTQHLPSMLENNNVMLNNWGGSEKYLWWDYHYTSVYTAHFLLWLVLAYRDIDKCAIIPRLPTSTESGVHIYRSEETFVAWFEGRKEYLAEKGPAITAVWTKKHGMILKGSFGPWQGPFGNKYLFNDIVLKNFCGLISVKKNKDWSKNRYIHKLLPSLQTKPALSLEPQFYTIRVEKRYNNTEIHWISNNEKELFFNLPSFVKNPQVKLIIDGEEQPLFYNSSFRNQYGWMYLYQSRVLRGKIWKIIL